LPKVVKDKFNHNGAHFNSTNGEGRQTAISLTLSEAPKHGEKKGERLPKKIANELQHALLADLEDELDGIAENIHVEYRLSGNVKKVGMDYHSGEELEAEYNLATYIITFEWKTSRKDTAQEQTFNRKSKNKASVAMTDDIKGQILNQIKQLSTAFSLSKHEVLTQLREALQQ
jgi:hypothetical protein